jgi:hypothetical protein
MILTEELLALPGKFQRLDGEFERLEEEYKGVKGDVETHKQDVAELKGDNFERKVRERAPSTFGRLIGKCRVLPIEELADILDDAVEKGIITEEE